MPKKVTFDVTSNTKQAQKGLQDVSRLSGVLQGALSKLGVVGTGISSVLDKFSGKSLDLTAALGVGSAAIGAAVAIGEKAISMYVDLGDKIRKYSVLTGESAEVSSRQVAAFEELGVSSDVAAAGMFKLAKAIESTPKKLTELGIVIAKNVDGSVDLNATLLNVMNAYQLTGDAAKKAAILFAAFGKSGAAMIPILETNVAQLKQLEAQVASVYTQADLDAIRQYTLQQKQLKEQSDALGVSLGRVLLPVQLALIESLNQEIYVQGKLEDARAKSGVSAAQMAHAGGQATVGLQKEYQAAQDAKVALDAMTQAQLDAANAAKAEADAEDVLYNAIEKSRDAGFAYRQSLLDLADAQRTVSGESLKAREAGQKIEDAQAKLTAAVKKYGAHSLQARDAQLALTKAQHDGGAAAAQAQEDQLRLEQAIFAVADAAVKQAEEQAALTDSTLTTKQAADIQIAALQKVESTLDKHSPLRKDIDAYIGQLRAIPGDITTNINTITAGYSAPRRKLAAGGSVAPGETAMVGEAGPELVTGGANGATVTPLSKGGGTVVNVTIAGGMFMDHGPTIDAFAKAILRHARFRPGT